MRFLNETSRQILGFRTANQVYQSGVEISTANQERTQPHENAPHHSGDWMMIITVLAGGATPVEQKRRTQLIQDSINATRAAIEEGVVPARVGPAVGS